MYIIKVEEETGDYYRPEDYITVGYAHTIDKAKALFNQWALEYEYFDLCFEVTIIEVTEGLCSDTFKGRLSAQIHHVNSNRFELSEWIFEE